MGWMFLYDCPTKQDLVRYLIRPQRNDNWTKDTLRHCCRGNCLWTVEKVWNRSNNQFRTFIMLYLMEKNEGCWGYKDMDEGMGPYYFSCPTSYFKVAGPTEDKGAQVLREKVLALRRGDKWVQA
jgi:hypothetical protein